MNIRTNACQVTKEINDIKYNTLFFFQDNPKKAMSRKGFSSKDVSKRLHQSTSVYQAIIVRVALQCERIAPARIRSALPSYQFPIAIL